MRDLATRVAASASLVLFPVLAWQALRVRLQTPRVPGAGGPSRGVVRGDGEPLRLLLLGESPVDGVGVDFHDEGLASQMATALNSLTGRHVEWTAVGHNGETARSARQHLVPRLHGKQADLLVVVIGVNDVFFQTSPRRWKHHLSRLIREAREQIGEVPVLVSAIPPVGTLDTLPQPLRSVLGLRAAALNLTTAELCHEWDFAYHLRMPDRTRPEHLCHDRFHPSAFGYYEWGRLLAEQALRRLPELRAQEQQALSG